MNDPNARGGVRRYLDTINPEEYVPSTGEVDLTELSLRGLADLYGSDKGSIKHNYTQYYEKIIADLLAGRDRKKAELCVVEAGIACGASLRMWGNYLPASKIVGYDIRPECASLCLDMKNVSIKIEDLRVFKPVGMVDLFVDDASHIAEDMVAMFDSCYRNVVAGGYYVIEDMSCTYKAAYTEQFRKYFNPKAVNDRGEILKFVDRLMMDADNRNIVAEIRYYPQMLVIKRAYGN